MQKKLGAHKKVISLPLGIRARQNVFKAMKRYQNFNKTKLFTINNSGWKERTRINEMLIAKFKKYNYTLINSFPGKFRKEEALKAGVMLYKDHYQEVAESLFTLCPSGLSMDSYRLWETLALGSIPVVESNAGFDRTYSNLPVLVVRNYSSITPSFLVEAYSCFQEHAEDYKYVHMTQQYWHHLLHRSLKHASVDHITRNHPYRNAYSSAFAIIFSHSDFARQSLISKIPVNGFNDVVTGVIIFVVQLSTCTFFTFDKGLVKKRRFGFIGNKNFSFDDLFDAGVAARGEIFVVLFLQILLLLLFVTILDGELLIFGSFVFFCFRTLVALISSSFDPNVFGCLAMDLPLLLRR